MFPIIFKSKISFLYYQNKKFYSKRKNGLCNQNISSDTWMVFPFMAVTTSPGLVAFPSGIFSVRGTSTTMFTGKDNSATAFTQIGVMFTAVTRQICYLFSICIFPNISLVAYNIITLSSSLYLYKKNQSKLINFRMNNKDIASHICLTTFFSQRKICPNSCLKSGGNSCCSTHISPHLVHLTGGFDGNSAGVEGNTFTNQNNWRCTLELYSFIII